MQLTALADAIKKLGRPKHGFSLCIYGPPKVGKTRLAATIAKVPQIKNVFLLDLENGYETLITMVRQKILTSEEAAKIQVIRIQDTAERPLGQETVLKLLTSTKPCVVCEEHGKVDCKDCKEGFTTFDITKLTHDDCVIVDSGSAFGISLLNYYCMGKGRNFKPGWDEYGAQVRDLNNALLIVQACKTNFIVITHELTVDGSTTLVNPKTGEMKDITYEERYPLMGTKNFSMTCAKAFSHVIYMQMGIGKHEAGSSSTYKHHIVTGSRGGWQIEKAPKLSLADIFEQLYHIEGDTTPEISASA